ncbi:MAG: peptidyl-prolyl cis-trans isomerase [Kiloniellales bacterium]
MLMQMRKPVAKVLTLLLFAVLILSFAVWGIGDIFRGAGRVNSVAVVGDTEIDQQDFSRALTREMNRLQTTFGTQLDIDQARAFGVVDQVLGQLINRALFDEQARRLGMVVSEEQIRDRIIAEPAFHNQFGEFDRNRFVQVLRGTGLSEGQFVDTLRHDIRRQQIADAATGALTAPETLAKALYAYDQEQRVGETITIPLSSVADPGQPDEQAIKAFYDENQDSFMKPETRAITLVQLHAEDLALEIAVAEDELRAEFEQRHADFVTPEQRTLEQIVLPDEEAARQARAELDGGADFASVAASATGGAPLDLGTFAREELAGEFPDLAEAAFRTPAGEVSQPVKSGFGWHLLHVIAVEPGHDPTFQDVRDELEHDIAMRQAIDSMISIANQLDDELASGAPLEEAASRLDLEARAIPAIDDRGDDAEGRAIEGLPPLDDLLPVLRETAAGEESLLTETSDGNYFILRVDGVTPAAPWPLEQVRNEVISRWQASERDRLAREQAQALAARAQEGVQLSALAEQEGLAYGTSEPLTRAGDGESGPGDRALAGQLFSLRQGEVTSYRAGDSYRVAKLIELRKAEPASAGEALGRVRERLSVSLENDLLAQFSNALRQEFGVSVNSRLIEDVLASF